MNTTDIMTPDHARNMRLIGHSDQGGRADGIQVMVENGFAYIGHLFSQGFSIIDVRDPKNPKPAGYMAAPPNTWNVHLQVADNLLLVIHGKDVFADAAFADEANYYKASAGTALWNRSADDRAQLGCGPGDLRYFHARSAEADRLHAGVRRHSPHLVHGRPLGLCFGLARRLYGFHLHDHRHVRSVASARGRALCASGDEPGRR